MIHPSLCTIVLVCAIATGTFADPWTTDYEKAVEKAKEKNKLLLLNFSGSDWCYWCIKLNDEVFSEKEFKAFADETLVCVTLDSPRGSAKGTKRAARTDEMMGRHRVKGVPTIILLDSDEQEIGRTGYKPGGAETYVEHLRTMIAPHIDLEAHEKDVAPETSKYRTWTSQSGSTIDAELIEHGGGWIKLKKKDGGMLKIKVNNLSENDRQFLVRR